MAGRWLAVDKTLLGAALGLLGLGLLMVYSASFPLAEQRWGSDTYFLSRQAAWAALGVAAILLLLRLDYRHWQRRPVAAAVLLASLAGLVAVLLLPSGTGARRWLSLGGLSVQPSEPAKLALVLYLAAYLARNDGRLGQWRRGLLPPLVVTGAVTALIAVEPDLGTALALAAVAALMLFAAGLAWRHLLALAAGGGALAALQIAHTGYQARRILAYLNPWSDPRAAGFQTIQSLIAVGTGGATGTGLAEGKQKLFFLPQPHTDFIYAVIGEELGFVGASLTLLAFLVILWRGVRAALRAPDRFGFYLGVGITAMLLVQALLNMSVVVNLVPATGIPLPLVSYGGSSLVTCCAAIGILLNLSQHA